MVHGITKFISFIAPVYDPVIDWFLGGETRVRGMMAERISPFKRGLDIGCGTGKFADMLREKGEVYAMDISMRMLKRAKRYGVEILRADALRIPFKSGVFDAVFSTMFMHHLTHEERISAMKEINRVLVDGGVYYSLEFGKEGLTRIGKAVTGLGFLEDHEIEGFDIEVKERWEKGLVFRKAVKRSGKIK